MSHIELTGHADDGDQDTRHKYRIAYVYAKQDGGRICCHNSCENNQIHDFLKNCFCFHNRNLLGGLYRENPVKSRNYEAVKSSKKWENVGNSYIIPALLLYRYSYI